MKQKSPKSNNEPSGAAVNTLFNELQKFVTQDTILLGLCLWIYHFDSFVKSFLFSFKNKEN